MIDEIKKISFFMFTFILLVFAMLPIFSMIETSDELTDYYYYEEL